MDDHKLKTAGGPRHVVDTNRVLAVVAVLAAVFYFLFDPMTTPFMPRCLFHEITGLQCMGCGSQRMVHALLHGDIAAAFRANALALLAVPFLIFGLWLEIRRTRHPGLYARVFSTKTVWTVAAILAVWFIVRNIAGL